MFGFLKEKLKKVVDVFSQKTQEESVPVQQVDNALEQQQSTDTQAVDTIDTDAQALDTSSSTIPSKDTKVSKNVTPQSQTTPEVQNKSTQHKDEKKITSQESKQREEKKIEVQVDTSITDKKDATTQKKHIQQKDVPTSTSSKQSSTKASTVSTSQKSSTPIVTQNEQQESVDTPETQDEPKSSSFFSRVTQVFTQSTLKEDKFEELFFELEIMLLEQNVALAVIEKLKENLKKVLVGKPHKRSDITRIITNELYATIDEVLSVPSFDIVQQIATKKPYVIMFVGVNGAGKTTTIAKVIRFLQKQQKTCVVAASDTFRAAAIQQLEQHTQALGVKCIKHDYGADPAAVAYDAIEHAKAKGIDVVLIDTAGRLHSNTNLMEELRKITKVAQPDCTLFIGEATTGNDCVYQAVQFNAVAPFDGIILTKVDVDQKGGAAISIG
ncbi:MAG: signal recognition particle-docking protein FtsY, partial [Candidatus Woesearchaeota archaeon]